MSLYYSCHLNSGFISAMLYLLMRQLVSFNIQLQAKLNFLKFQIPSKEIVIQKSPFHSRRLLILRTTNQSKRKTRLWIKLHNKDKKSCKLSNQLMQSQENRYQSNQNFSRLKYRILSLQVLKVLLFMTNQKVFHMLEMLQEKAMNKPQKEKKESQLKEIKRMGMLSQQICWNLTATLPSLHHIHAI